MSRKHRRVQRPAGWDAVAHWYDGWMGVEGGEHHRSVAIPTVLDLAGIQPGDHVLDVGAGAGVLAPSVTRAGGEYTGVDVSGRLLNIARKRHSSIGRFIRGDARRLSELRDLQPDSFDKVIFLLSIQDMHPLQPVLRSAAWALKEGGRVVMLMTHPCFRIPRQSGWDWDANRKLRYRRIDSYLTPLTVPMKEYPGQERGATISFHRPLEHYINGLGECGLLVDSMLEIPYPSREDSASGKAEERASQEIPLFLALRARKLRHSG